MPVVTKAVMPSYANVDGARILVIEGERWIMRSHIERAFGLVPQGPYQVIFALSPRGTYLVRDYEGVPVVESLALCPLPRSWIGLRINRYVVPMSAGSLHPVDEGGDKE